MRTLITRIAQSVRNGDDDTALNVIIQQHITSYGLSETVAEWRVVNYEKLRRWSYPCICEFNDSKVKLASGDTTIEAEGQAQLDQYVADCLAVKSRFPKS